ncbi:MAG: hypothetical protein CMP84_16040 [Gammaproteobacteria bacterium]|nr:hypothetical protein [Gammaproteobacteria bacterium]
MTDLVTLIDYKAAEGVTTPKSDAQLNFIIPSVSQLVKTYCANSFVDYYSTNKVDTINVNWGTHLIQLTESPVNSIVSVEERETYDSSYVTLTTTSYEYYLDSATDSLIRTTGGTTYKNWARGPGAVRVTYKAGYASLPADLRLAVFDLITYYLKDEHKERRSIAGASIQNQASTSQRNNVAFPDHIKRVLDLYKNF